MTNAAQNLRRVSLDLHPPAAPITPLPPLQFTINLLDINRQTGGQTFNYRDQRASVRFPGCDETKHKKAVTSDEWQVTSKTKNSDESEDVFNSPLVTRHSSL